MAFPLFDLPDEAVELVLGSVRDLEDKRALRLVCKRSRASVDSRVVLVSTQIEAGGDQPLDALVRAPWNLRHLDLSGRDLGDAGAATLAAARWPALRELALMEANLGDAGAASLAAAHWPALKALVLSDNSLGDAGVASLAAAHWPALQLLCLSHNSFGDAGAASLAAASWPAVTMMMLGGTNMSSAGTASLQARWPAAGTHVF